MNAGAAYANGVAPGGSAFGAFSCAGAEAMPMTNTRLTTADTASGNGDVFITVHLGEPHGERRRDATA